MGSKQQANELAKALSDFTIESLEKDEQNFGWSNSKNSLLDFPNEVLVNIFSFVGNPKFNKDPTEVVHLPPRDSPKPEWIQRMDREFAMKNLMSLRRVCTVFEDIINNGMMPGLDYEPIEVDLVFRATESLNAVQMFKYGGTGAIYPCTRLERISKFNDGDDFEHLQKFEKIRTLSFVGIPLTRDLFQTFLRMDLTSAKEVICMPIPDVQLGEDVNIVEYIQNFLDTVDSQAKFFFNSEVFNQDLVLFGQEAAASAPRPATRVLRPHRHRAFNRENFGEDGDDDIKRKFRGDVFEFLRHRAINIIHNILLSEPHIPHKDYEYRLKDGYNHWKKELMKTFKKKIEKQSKEFKELGERHLNKVFGSMENQPIEKEGLSFDMIVLKMVTKEGASPTHAERSMIDSRVSNM